MELKTLEKTNHNACSKLLSEISVYRSKESASVNLDDEEYVMVNSSTLWTDLFIRNFLETGDTSHDDLLFFVRKTSNSGARYVPKFETEIEVFRQDSKKLPIGNIDIDWEETLYLNIIMQHFEYVLTCAVCSRTSSNQIQILHKRQTRVYASPSHRSLSGKGETEQITYPDIFFTLDNFEEILSSLTVRDGEMMCVELVATDKSGTSKTAIFNGSVHYDSLKKAYDIRASVSSRGRRGKDVGYYFENERVEFLKLRGPAGKGFSEMAVTKVKGGDIETPSSEPGFSMTDGSFEEMEENAYSRRRMSDPSSSLGSYVRGWQARRVQKSKSQSAVNEDYDGAQIEAADVRDVLDDPATKRLWTIPGFSQTFHLWKENKRRNSLPLHSAITYVTVPWHHLIADLISCKNNPILTF